MPLAVGIGAEDAKAPVGKGGAAGPGLLPGDHVMIAVPHRFRLDRRHVAARSGFGPGLGPDHLASRHRRQEAGLLLLGAEFHDGRAEQEDAVLVGPVGAPGTEILFLEDQPLDQVQPAPAVCLRPGDHAPVAAGQGPFPFDMLVIAFAAFQRDERLLRHVGFHPGTHFGPERLLFGGIFQMHQNFAALPVSTKASRLFWLSSCMYISSVKPCSQR